MRVIYALMVLVFILVGASFAALNTTSITIDFYFHHLTANSGFIVLFALLAGALLGAIAVIVGGVWRSEEHTSELQSLMRISYAVFCLQQKKIPAPVRHPCHE